MTGKDNFATATPTDLITAIQFSVYVLKLHHTGINSDLVGVHSIQAGEAIPLKLHGESDTIIMKMGWWSSLTFLRYTHNKIRNISKWLD